MSKKSSRPERFSWSAVGVGGLFVLAAGSQVKLQTVERDPTLKKAHDSKRFDLTVTDVARRGGVYTSDGKPLAEDDQTYDLTLDFTKVPHTDAFYMELADATGLPASDFSVLANSGAKSKTWLEPISSDRFKAINAMKTRWRADGLSLSLSRERNYPLGPAASCLVGVIRNYKEKTVYTGIEHRMNAQLTGKDGVKIGLTDRTGAFLPMRMEAGSTPRKDGQDVVLTIDSDLQMLASEAIQSAVETNKADNGVALVMNPKTGEVLAMANWPSFDPNTPTANQGKFGFNPAYMAQLEPGSTFKILTLAKGLDDGKVSLTDRVYCTGEWHPTPSTTIHCDKHHGTRSHGSVSTIDAIARSCNVSAAIWATKIGRDIFMDYIDSLGLTQKSSLQMPGEVKGLLRRNEYAHQLQLATLGFGQSVTCTPIGLIGAFDMLANNGIRIEPRILSRVGNHVVATAPGHQVIKPETAKKVMDCMTAVIESDEGTGAKLRIPGYKLAGKTGTAEKVGRNEKGYVSNFVGFVPAENPKAVILVMVNNPKNGLYYGASVAGPVFREIAKAVIRHYNIPPTEPIIEHPTPKSIAEANKKAAILVDE